MRSKRPTIDDVARQAGVSKATVSAVLNNTGSVKPTTRDQVVGVMELLNYRPTQLAGRAGTRRPRSIGLLIKEIDNPYYAEIVLGARTLASESGYTLVVASSEGDFEAERKAIELFQAKDVDGLIATPVLGEHADLSHFFELKRRNFPFVLLEEVLGVPASLVDIDNSAGSRKAVEYLIEQGHTRIAHFAGPRYSMHSQERIDGVRHACSASRLIFSDYDIVTAGAHLADGYRAALDYFRDRPENERPTAVTCYNDLVAIGVCRALRELGLGVPEHVSVIGFDDIPLLEYLPVPLTTVRVPKYRMAEIATEMLIRHVESRTAIPPQKVYLDAELVVRASCRALRADGESSGARRPAGSQRRVDSTNAGAGGSATDRSPHQETAPTR